MTIDNNGTIIKYFNQVTAEELQNIHNFVFSKSQFCTVVYDYYDSTIHSLKSFFIPLLSSISLSIHFLVISDVLHDPIAM